MANDGVNDPVNAGRRRFLTATTVAVGAVGAGFAAVPFIKSWNPSARAQLAGAPVTVDISALQEGQRLIGEWRGQPIWIVKRSKATLAALPKSVAARFLLRCYEGGHMMYEATRETLRFWREFSAFLKRGG